MVSNRVNHLKTIKPFRKQCNKIRTIDTLPQKISTQSWNPNKYVQNLITWRHSQHFILTTKCSYSCLEQAYTTLHTYMEWYKYLPHTNATLIICSYYAKVLYYCIYQSNDNHQVVTNMYFSIYNVYVTNEQEEEQWVRQKIKTPVNRFT
jgi:hypothetical protein